MKLKTRNKVKLLILAVLIGSLLITACSKETAGLKEGVVATVNGTEILEEEYNKLLDYYLSELRAKHDLTDDLLNQDSGTGMTLLETLKQELLDTIILNEIIAKEAEKSNIEIDEEELQQLYEENHLKLMEEDEEYKKIIEENKIDENFIKNQMRKDLLGYEYKIFFFDQLKITEEDIETFYNENSQIFSPEEIKAKHIVVEDEKLAKDIAEKLEDGEDFASLAGEYSTEPAAQSGSGGDLGYFGRGAMLAEFEEAAFNLEIGEISEPVKTQYGYHIIIVEDKRQETVEIEDAREQIEFHIKEIDYQTHIGETFENADIVRRDEL